MTQSPVHGPKQPYSNMQQNKKKKNTISTKQWHTGNPQQHTFTRATTIQKSNAYWTLTWDHYSMRQNSQMQDELILYVCGFRLWSQSVLPDIICHIKTACNLITGLYFRRVSVINLIWISYSGKYWTLTNAYFSVFLYHTGFSMHEKDCKTHLSTMREDERVIS